MKNKYYSINIHGDFYIQNSLTFRKLVKCVIHYSKFGYLLFLLLMILRQETNEFWDIVARASSRGQCRTGESIPVWQKAAVRSQKHKETVANTVVSRSALNRVWFFKQFEKIECLVAEILVPFTTSIR